MPDERLPFASLYVAVPTLFDERGRIDEKAHDHLIDYLKARDLSGLALLTEAGEDAVLSAEERHTIIERTMKRELGAKQVLVSISAIGTREAVDLARFAEKHGAKGILIAPLAAPGLGYRELYRHVDRVARGVSIPTYLTLRPGNAPSALLEDELATLGKHEALKGVHLPQGTPSQIKPWAKRLKGKNAEIFSGCALSFGSAAKAGATAVICGLTVIAADQAAKMIEAVRRADQDAQKKLEKESKPALDLLGPPIPEDEQTGVQKLATKIAQRSLSPALAASVPFGLIKEGLKAQGHPVPAFVRPPYEPITPADVERLKHVMKSSRLIS